MSERNPSVSAPADVAPEDTMIGVPERYEDCKAEYREGWRRGYRGRGVDYPIHDPEAPMEEERKRAWDAGVRAGRKRRIPHVR